MDQLRTAVDELVRAGIRAYIGLLGRGERERSRRLLSDALQLSALVAGGPSARFPPLVAAEPDGPLHGCVVLLTVRSMLATLLVLKATSYWQKLPALEELLHCCMRTADCVDGGQYSARTADPLNCACSHETGAASGCRRNSALPVQPELVFQPDDGRAVTAG